MSADKVKGPASYFPFMRLGCCVAALALAGCSSEPAPERPPATETEVASRPEPSEAPAEPDAPPTPDAKPAPPAATAPVLGLEGLGPLRIGEPVPAGSGWGERFAQISDTCRMVSSPAVPGVYAIVEGGRVRRITLSEGSAVKLVEDIGVGATEAEVRAAFPGFRESPHEYVDPPGKYLTAPNAAGGDPALRFEIGPDGKVSLVHVGTMPVLGYVEGCA